MKNEVKEYIDVLETYEYEYDFNEKKTELQDEFFGASPEYFKENYEWDLTQDEINEAFEYIDGFEYEEPETFHPSWTY